MHPEPNTCLLSAVEQRLADALLLWREAEKHYFAPNLFRLDLNNCIQTLRNVTFVLQKSKQAIASFDTWYEPWQERMRSDGILRWLVNARNTVVKEGDIRTLSKARVALLASWNEPPIQEIDVPPLSTPQECAVLMAATKPHGVALEVCILRAERRWVDAKLPETELLEALSHVFKVLSAVLFDAHSHFAAPHTHECAWRSMQQALPHGVPACMVRQDWHRTAFFDINSGMMLKSRDIPVKLPDGIQEVAKAHYGGLGAIGAALRAAHDLNSRVVAFTEMAKRVMLTDGYHLPTAIIDAPGGRGRLCHLKMDDRTEKHMVFRGLAAEIERLGATSVLIITEVWTAKFDPTQPLRHAADFPERGEALQIVGLDNEGNVSSFLVPFTRQENTIQFAESIPAHDDTLNFLNPIRDVWRRQKKCSNNASQPTE